MLPRSGSADPLYSSPRWRAIRKAYLTKHPQCSAYPCPKPATHLDHIVSVRSAPHLAFESSNWQGLCAACHSAKTARVDGGFGNARRAG